MWYASEEYLRANCCSTSASAFSSSLDCVVVSDSSVSAHILDGARIDPVLLAPRLHQRCRACEIGLDVIFEAAFRMVVRLLLLLAKGEAAAGERTLSQR